MTSSSRTVESSVPYAPLTGLPPGASQEVVPFVAGDGMSCNLRRVRPADGGSRGPVLLVHGAGVRANIFAAPSGRHFVAFLLEAGYDVWLENWRASIDLPFNRWTLDEAAVHDHPAAVRTVREATGADRFPAVIHCQGSTSFAMSLVAGLVPEIRTVVSNAVSLHPVVPWLSKAKLDWAVPVATNFGDHLDPQWGLHRSGFLPTFLDIVVKTFHHECRNPVCKHVSFTYGSGFPALWRHENLNEATHDWLTGEFAKCPFTFFEQMARCVSAGRLVPTGRFRELPEDLATAAPRTDARFALFTGLSNLCFLPESQRRTFAHLSRFRRDHVLRELPGYGHLDVFMGKDAARDVFPLIVAELEKDA